MLAPTRPRPSTLNPFNRRLFNVDGQIFDIKRIDGQNLSKDIGICLIFEDRMRTRLQIPEIRLTFSIKYSETGECMRVKVMRNSFDEWIWSLLYTLGNK